MTIKDIARHCGVSVSTVSRVLNKKPDVSDSVREKVLRTLEDLNFVPNSSARALVTPVADAVGVVYRGASSPFYADIIAAMEEVFSRAGLTVITEGVRHGQDELWAGAALAKSKRLRGLVFLGGRFDYAQADIEKLKVPFVCCTYTNVFGALSEDSYSSVTTDDIKTGYDATKALIDRGHRRIAVVLSTADDRSISELRYMGYRKALADTGIDYDPSLLIEAGEYSMADAREAVERAIDRGRDFTAVFAVSDLLAIAVMKALSNKGRRVPEDCSVIGVDGLEIGAYTVPGLCSLAQPARELGERSAGVLLDMMNKKQGKHIVLDSRLSLGGSIADLSQER